MTMIPRKNVYLFDIDGSASGTRYYPDLPDGLPESLGGTVNSMRLPGPRGRLTGIRMRLHDEVGAVTSIRLQIYQDAGAVTSDDHLVYDSGVLTDGVDGIVLAESATTAFWLDNLPADAGVFGNGTVHNGAGEQRAASRENFLIFVLTQVGAAGANQYAVAFDTLEEE